MKCMGKNIRPTRVAQNDTSLSILRITWWLLHFQILRPISRKIRELKVLSPGSFVFCMGRDVVHFITGQRWALWLPQAEDLRKVSVQHSGFFKRAKEKSHGDEVKWVKSCCYLQTALFLRKKWFSHTLLLTNIILFNLFSPDSWLVLSRVLFILF